MEERPPRWLRGRREKAERGSGKKTNQIHPAKFGKDLHLEHPHISGKGEHRKQWKKERCEPYQVLRRTIPPSFEQGEEKENKGWITMKSKKSVHKGRKEGWAGSSFFGTANS